MNRNKFNQKVIEVIEKQLNVDVYNVFCDIRRSKVCRQSIKYCINPNIVVQLSTKKNQKYFDKLVEKIKTIHPQVTKVVLGIDKSTGPYAGGFNGIRVHLKSKTSSQLKVN